jgi:putative transposase
MGTTTNEIPVSEELGIIRLVVQSHLSAERTLQELSIPRSTFNRWYDRFLAGGVDALENRRSRPKRVCNHIPEETCPPGTAAGTGW